MLKDSNKFQLTSEHQNRIRTSKRQLPESLALLESPIFTAIYGFFVTGEDLMNKQVLIEKLNLSYSFIEHTISKLTEKEVTESIIQGERTPKDILAHIAAWNWNGIEWIKSVASGEKPILQMEGHKLEERDAVFAQLNEELHNKNQDKSLQEVLDDYHSSWTTMLSLVETLVQEDLDRTFDLEWALNPVQGWNVVAWRFWHADNHGKQIEEWLHIK